MSSETLFSLAGRTALITGGSRGIGRMIARAFVERGARVYISSRKVDDCNTVAAELSINGGVCHSLPENLSSVEGCARLAAAFARHEDKLDILVNNAGAAWLAPFDSFPEKGWDTVMDLNLKSPFFLSQAMIPFLRRAAGPRTPAKIINVASVDGLIPSPRETYPYQASKAGLIHLTRRLAMQLAGENICVNAIAPGAFASDLNPFARDRPEELIPHIPSKRIGREEDIQGAAIYLASRAGDYVVGTTLAVDGGVAFATSY